MRISQITHSHSASTPAAVGPGNVPCSKISKNRRFPHSVHPEVTQLHVPGRGKGQ